MEKLGLMWRRLDIWPEGLEGACLRGETGAGRAAETATGYYVDHPMSPRLQASSNSPVAKRRHLEQTKGR